MYNMLLFIYRMKRKTWGANVIHHRELMINGTVLDESMGSQPAAGVEMIGNDAEPKKNIHPYLEDPA